MRGKSSRTWKVEGPSGYHLTVDLDEVYPDDPGAGAPFLIEDDEGASGTFWAAYYEGEIEGALSPLTGRCVLNKLSEKVQGWVRTTAEGIKYECESAIYKPDKAWMEIWDMASASRHGDLGPMIYVVIWGGKPFCSFDDHDLVDDVLAFFKV